MNDPVRVSVDAPVSIGCFAARHALRDRELTVDRGGGRIERRALAGDDEVLQVLDGVFGLRFPAGTRFERR